MNILLDLPVCAFHITSPALNPTGMSPKLALDTSLCTLCAGASAGWEEPSHLHFSSVQSLSRVRLFATPWTATQQASLSITNSWGSPKLVSVESVMPPSISSSVVPFSSCLQSFPASGSFPMSQLIATGGQIIGVAASHQSFQ